MRVAAILLVALTAVACSDNDPAPPIPLAQRFLTAEDAPGSEADPVEQGQTTADFDEFIAELSNAVVHPDKAEMTTVFEQAGFKRAGLDVRFLGETHAPSAPHLFAWFIDLESEDGATSALDWLETDATKPCPMSCATQVSGFSVDGIPDMRGVHRLATAEDIERAGMEDEQPSESYWTGFTVSSTVYMVELSGPPGSVNEEQAQSIASAYHDRLDCFDRSIHWVGCG